MAPRANWKGHLKLSYISCPVSLYPASSKSERVSFNKINKETGHRLKQQYVDADNGKVVEGWQQIKGYEVAKNEYILVEDEELDNIKIEATKIIDITSFVKVAEIDTRYFEAPYWIVPNDKVGQDAYALIREAMKKKNVGALATVVIARREKTILLQPYGNGIIGTTLRFPYEVRDSEAYFEDIPEFKLPKEYLDMAAQVVEAKIKPFDAKTMIDRYEEAIVSLIREKKAGYISKPQEDIRKPATFSVSIKDLLALTLAGAKEEDIPKQPEVVEIKPTKKRSKKAAIAA